MSTGDEPADRGVATPPASRDEALGAESAIDPAAKQDDNGENTPDSGAAIAIPIKDELEAPSMPDASPAVADLNALNNIVSDLEPLPASLPAEDVAMLIDAMPQSAADPEQIMSTDVVPLGTDPASLAADSFNFALPQPSTPVQPILPLQPHDSITPLALNNNSVPGSTHDPMMSTPFAASPLPMVEPEAPRIQAFAKLEFDDGQFYMNTYSVLLGRDIRAARMAHQSSKAEDNGEDDDRDASNEAPTSSKHRRVGSSRIAGSAVSESGGIIGEDDRQMKRRSRRSSRRSKSSDSASHAPLSRKNSNLPASMLNDYQSMARPSSGNVHPVNPSALLPSPDECPLIPIHPPASGTGGHKGISRKHAKIMYNFETNAFEVDILGKNGVFVDDHWFPAGEKRPLHSGSYIQIGGVGVRFILPDIPASEPVHAPLPEEDGIYGYDEDDALDVDDSVDFDDDSEDSPDNDNEGEIDDDEDDGNEGNEDDEEDEEDEEDDEEEELPPEPEPPKKRGPGRPPKNGISRREMAERARAEKYRLTLTINPPKNKVGRPRKYPRPEDLPQKPEKRKYTRRNIDEKNGRTATAKKDKVTTAKPQQKRPLKPPRSPSPEFDESQLTPEQLQKPQSSYVVLIYEAISNSKTGAMSLPQIYRAIERKYPFFKLRVQTNGWQSSVRHNLSQHPAFCKVERDGKGWMWGLVPDVSVEKERKRKSSPSSREQPAQYQSRPTGQYQKSSDALAQASNGRNLTMSGQSGVPPAGGQRVTGIMPAKFVNSSAQGMGGFRTANSPALGVKPASTATPSSGYYANARASQAGATTATTSRQDAEVALNREINKSVMAFQTKLTESLQKNGVQNAKAVVQSGVDRALGHSSASTTPGGEHPQERNIMTALQSLIMQIRQKHANNLGGRPAEPAAAAPKPAATPAARPQETNKSQAAQSQLLNLLTAIGKGKRVGTPPTNGNGAGKGPPAPLGQKRGIESVDSENGELRQSKRIAMEQESSRSA